MKKLFVLLLVVGTVLSGCSSTKSAENVEIGDYIKFGTYEQDNDISNGKEQIEWIVLAKEGNKVLIISEYGLDIKPYNEERVRVTWESCDLRDWLNEEFLDEAFSSEEQRRIATTTVRAEKNPQYITNPGNDTEDKVFLLSIQEAEKYFSSDSNRMVVATEYAIDNGVYVSDNGKSHWWLRSPGDNGDLAACVLAGGTGGFGGSISYSGIYVEYDDIMIRPALWLQIE